MTAIFISHSSQDKQPAAALRQRLEAQGHRSLFLDFDPVDGIPAGREWERELYQQLHACHALIVLCSAHSMSSQWCFAEITHAKALGKPIFPLRISPCEIAPVLASRQLIDMSSDTEAGYQRLWIGLRAAGLDPADSFDWDGTRPPYPGLLSFQEQDAAIFFGRDQEVRETIERLQRLHRFGGPQMLVVLGPSGSGKSSLVRAGLIPRLRRDRDQWLVIPPMRPEARPLQALAIVLAEACAAQGLEHDWVEICTTLEQAAADQTDPTPLQHLLRRLRVAAGHPDASVVLILDQTEELLDPAHENAAGGMLRLLKAVLEAPGSKLMLICTLRSDFLGIFQQHAVVRDLSFEDIRVGPMPADRLKAVIEGPARIAAIELEAGLAEALAEDTHTDDALPLLAFTLRELYERYGEDKRLDIEEYRERLGGVAGSVARAADAVLAALRLSDTQQLRRAFLAMVRINDEGHYARRPVRWSELPLDVHAMIQQFVQARLLTTGEDGGEPVVEVAHETLFRSWGQLRSWLEEDRGFLLWQQRMREAAAEWERAGREPEALLAGGRLSEAERWFDRADAMSADVRTYVDASRERSGLERVLAERRRRRTVSILGGGLVAALLLAGFAATQWWHADEQRRVADEQRRVADVQSRIALARHLAAQAQLLAEDVTSELTQQALLAAESLKRFPTLQGFMAWNEVRTLMPVVVAQVEHDGEVLGLAWSPDGEKFATASEDNSVRVWNSNTGEALQAFRHSSDVNVVAFSPDGRRLATGSDDTTARLWDVERGRELARLEHGDERVKLLAFSPDSSRLASASNYGGLYHLWDVATGQAIAIVHHEGNGGWMALTFSPDGSALATAGTDRTVRIWDVATGVEKQRLPHPHQVYTIGFSPDGGRLATGTSWDGEIRIWDLQTEKVLNQMAYGNSIFDIEFSSDGKWLAGGGRPAEDSQSARIWDAANGAEVVRMETIDSVNRIEFNPKGDRLMTITSGMYVTPGTVRVWDAATGKEVARPGPEIASKYARFSPDGLYLATAGGDDKARVWSLYPRAEKLRLEHARKVWGVGFSHTGQQILSAEGHSVRAWNTETGAEEGEFKYFDGNAGGIIQNFDISEDGRWLATSDEGGRVVLWDTRSGASHLVLQHGGGYTTVTFSPDSKLLASAGADRIAQVWDIADRRERFRVSHEDAVHSVDFSPDSAQLVTASADKTARVWSVATGQQRLSLVDSEPLAFALYSPDGKHLVTVRELGEGEHGDVRLWDATSGAPGPKVSHDDVVRSAEFSPDGKWLVTASRDRTAKVWRVDNGEERLRLVHEGPVNGAVFSDDGQWLATASAWEKSARVWDAATGHEVARVHHDESVEAVVFSPDGRWLLTGSEDHTVRLWKWTAEDIVEEACARLTRNLTADEWSRFIGNEPYQPTCAGITGDSKAP